MWRLLLLVVLSALATGTSVPGQTCGSVLSPGACRATQDYVIVADNSWSVEDDYATISNIMTKFVNSFDMDKNDPESPRVGCAAPSHGVASATSIIREHSGATQNPPASSSGAETCSTMPRDHPDGPRMHPACHRIVTFNGPEVSAGGSAIFTNADATQIAAQLV